MHAFLDKYSVTMTSALLKNGQWFRESIDSPGFKEHLDNILMELPKIQSEGFYEVKGTCLAGSADPAFHIAKWLGPEYPTVIYHHGNNESPFDYGFAAKNTFKSVILNNKDRFKANLINMRAPFHNSGMKFYIQKIGRLTDFTAMLSVSVKLIELLTQYLKRAGCGKVIVTGVSLGGWVTNLHRSYYNSADAYIPIFAGAALEELFLTSYYKKLAGHLVMEKPDELRKTLNFEQDFMKVPDENVFPLLARYDQFIEFDRQKQCYSEKSISVIDKGHITGALSSKELRDHILARVN